MYLSPVGTHVESYEEMPLKWVVFSFKNGSFLYKNILKHKFILSKHFECMPSPKHVENGPIFQEKTLKWVSFFCQNVP